MAMVCGFATATVPTHRARRSIDEGDAVVAVDGDEQQLAIGLHRQTVRRLADFYRMRDAIRRRIDHADRRREIAADVYVAAVRRNGHAMRARTH